MINLLIIENDIFQSIRLTNIISNSLSCIKVYNISLDEKEAISQIQHHKIHIILIDLNSLNISCSEILHYIEYHKLNNFLNSIITICKKGKNLINNPYIYTNIESIVNTPILINELKDCLMHKHNLELKNKIAHELEYLCYNFSHIGTQQLLECIYLSLNNSYYINNLSKTIYPILAHKFFTTSNTIKCNIFKATENSYYECEEEKLKKYFNKKFISKPKTKDVILAISKHINSSNFSS